VSVSCLVKFVQGLTVGTPGVALIGATGTSVTVSNGGTNPAPDPGTWTFDVLGVPSSSSVPTGVVQTGPTPTWNFTPDVPGCYVVSLTVVDDTTGAASTDVRAFGIYTSLGAPYLIPAFTGDDKSLNFGSQTTGWDVYMEAWLNLLLALATGAVPANIVNVVAPGTIAAAPGARYYVDLGVAGGDVTFTTAGSIGARQSFFVKLVDPTGVGTGGHKVTVEPIVAGLHVESRAFPGTLNALDSASYLMTVLGDEVELESNDGTNLWA